MILRYNLLAAFSILLLELLPYWSSAQSFRKYNKIEEQTFYINGKDSVLRFQATNLKLKKFHSDRVYFWYKGNSILRTHGGGDGRLLNGEYTCFFSDNNLKEKGSFCKGLKWGTWTNWRPDGTVLEKSNWRNGLLHGQRATFDERGVEMISERYRNGKIRPVKQKIVRGGVSAENKVREKKVKEKSEKKAPRSKPKQDTN